MKMLQPTEFMKNLYFASFYVTSVIIGFLLWNEINDTINMCNTDIDGQTTCSGEDNQTFGFASFKRFALAFAVIGILNPLVSWINVVMYVANYITRAF